MTPVCNLQMQTNIHLQHIIHTYRHSFMNLQTHEQKDARKNALYINMRCLITMCSSSDYNRVSTLLLALLLALPTQNKI
jgi:hypothetical protein